MLRMLPTSDTTATHEKVAMISTLATFSTMLQRRATSHMMHGRMNVQGKKPRAPLSWGWGMEVGGASVRATHGRWWAKHARTQQKRKAP